MKTFFRILSLACAFLLLESCCALLLANSEEAYEHCSVYVPFNVTVSGGGTYSNQSTSSSYEGIPDDDGFVQAASAIPLRSHLTGNQAQREIANQILVGGSGEAVPGFTLGVRSGGLPLGSKTILESGLLLSQKGSKNSTGSGANAFEEKLTMTYLDVPIITRYMIGEKGFNLYGGLQPSLLLGAKRKTDFAGESQTQKVKDEFKGLDFGLVFGLGYRFKSKLSLNLGYDLGLSNINDSEFGGFETRNRALKLTLGYGF